MVREEECFFLFPCTSIESLLRRIPTTTRLLRKLDEKITRQIVVSVRRRRHEYSHAANNTRTYTGPYRFSALPAFYRQHSAQQPLRRRRRSRTRGHWVVRPLLQSFFFSLSLSTRYFFLYAILAR